VNLSFFPRLAAFRCGSLLLHRSGLAPPTPCRFVPAHRNSSFTLRRQRSIRTLEHSSHTCPEARASLRLESSLCRFPSNPTRAASTRYAPPGEEGGLTDAIDSAA
jgi:hypothetical protein